MSYGSSSQTSWSLKQHINTPSDQTSWLMSLQLLLCPYAMRSFAAHQLLFLFICTFPSPQFCLCLAHCCVLSCRMSPCCTAGTRHGVSALLSCFYGLLALAHLLFLRVWLFQIDFFLRSTVLTAWISRKHPKIWCRNCFIVLVSYGAYGCSLANVSLCPSVNWPFFFPTFSEVLFYS